VGRLVRFTQAKLWLALIFAGSVLIAAPAMTSGAPQSRLVSGQSAQDVIAEQLAAFKSGDGEGAYRHASDRTKQVFRSATIFMHMVEHAYPVLHAPASWTFARARQLNGEALVQEVLLTDGDGREWSAIYVMELGAGSVWRVNGVSLKRTGAQEM
jgi:hypothetical protein